MRCAGDAKKIANHIDADHSVPFRLVGNVHDFSRPLRLGADQSEDGTDSHFEMTLTTGKSAVDSVDDVSNGHSYICGLGCLTMKSLGQKEVRWVVKFSVNGSFFRLHLAQFVSNSFDGLQITSAIKLLIICSMRDDVVSLPDGGKEDGESVAEGK